MRIPKIGVVGGGVYGTQVLKAFKMEHDKGYIELVALADLNEETLKEQKAVFGVETYTNYIEMLDSEDLDGIAVVTPDYLHKEITLEAAKRKIHTLVQKPIDVTYDGAKEMIEACEKNSTLLFVDFHKRYDPAHRQIKNLIDTDKLGDIQYGHVYVEDKILVPSVWFKTWAHKSSPAWFIGIHFIDLMYWLVSSKPKRVYATGNKGKLTSMGIDTYDSIQAKIEFENGFNFSIDSNWIIPNNFPSIVNQAIRVVGTEGISEVDTQDRGVSYVSSQDDTYTVSNPFGYNESNGSFGGYTIESMVHFTQIVSGLINGKELKDYKNQYPSGEEAAVSTLICEAIHKSLEIKDFVNLY